MLRSRILLKLYLGYALLVLIPMVSVWLLYSGWVERDTLGDIQSSLRTRAHLLAEMSRPVLLGREPAPLQDRVRGLGERLDTRFTVIAPDGVVLADSHELPSAMDNHGNRAEIVTALEEGIGFSSRRSDTLGQDMMYVAVPLHDGDRLMGVARTAFPLGVVDARLADLRSSLLVAGLVAVFLALVIGLVVARRVTVPLSRMTRMAEAISTGAEVPPIHETRTDEIGDLSRALSSMSARLKERMELLRAERNKMVAVLAGMSEGLIAVDPDQRILHLNDSGARMLGVTAADLAGRTLFELTRVPKVAETLQRTLEEGCIVQDEIHLTDSRGRLLQLNASPLRASNGVVTGAVLVMHDVTELRHLETVRRDFVANVSHELKTPLAAIRGLAETVDDDPEMPDDVRSRFLKKLRNQVERLTAIVADLLVLSRLEAQDDATREPLDLRDELRAAVRRFGDEIQQSQVQVEIELPEDAMIVLGDEENVREILDNLLGNAIRYTPEGGQIWLRMREEHGAVNLEVEDTGIGIEPSQQDRIFERFFRVDKARSRDAGGTGLGLSIVKHAAESLGGSISLESHPGKGSCFRVRLPRGLITETPPNL